MNLTDKELSELKKSNYSRWTKIVDDEEYETVNINGEWRWQKTNEESPWSNRVDSER
jgi:hypothetical protein